MSPASRSVIQTRDAVRAGELSAEQVVRDALDCIASVDGTIHAFLQTFTDEAIAKARAVDGAVGAGGDPGPLAGVPIAIKDNICLDFGTTTCASRFLEEYRSPFCATVATRLLDAGAVIVGKTNLDEFAMGCSTQNSAFGPSRNPWDTTRVPGGSSGGSAAAVAGAMVPASLGSDTGGSIRQPAGLCGLVGLKPTYGRVSRYGLVAFASSLDQIGPLTRTVADAAAVLGAISGPDPHDATSAQNPVPDFERDLDRPISDLTIGVPSQGRSDANHPGVNAALETAIDRFSSLGARIVDVRLPHVDHAIAAYYIVAPAEASSNLARFDGVRFGRRAEGDGDLLDLYCRSRAEGFGAEVKRRIMLGTHVLSSGYYDAYYVTALKVRRKIQGDYQAAFDAGCHALLLPSSPRPAFRIGERTDDPLALYLEDTYTVGANLAGLPAITFPGGFVEVDGTDLPVGLQLIGPPWSEHDLLRIARLHERACAYHERVAPMT